MPVYKNEIIVINEINESGDMILMEHSTEIRTLFGIQIHKKSFKRDTSQTELKLSSDAKIGFKKENK